MNTYYLAVDIGASSGRHMLSWLEDGKIQLEEVYRFENGLEEKNGHMCWNVEHLFQSIIAGLKRCKEIDKIPSTIGIDTWGVDFILLDQEDKRIGDAIGYRDGRTTGIEKKVFERIEEDALYARTGIQKQPFNTIYQLMALKEQTPEHMQQAKAMLFMPDYFNYLLTGVKKTEYTNATTSQLVSPITKDWDWELIETLGYNKEMFGPITMPGTKVGMLKSELEEEIGFTLEVVQVATHDTASAVISVPAKEKNFLYISSGTWSLMGTEQEEANCSMESKKANLTNEGGYEYRFRFLKNIMGLWMIQSVRHEWDDQYSFATLCELAKAADDFPSRVDVNDATFLAPKSMIEAIKEYCRKTNQKVPKAVGEIATVIYQSLANSYGETVEEMERITGRTYSGIYIVGGGSNAEYLNQLTAKSTGKTVYAGPGEATAIGNIVVQMIHNNELSSIEEARAVIFDSFKIKTFQ